MARYTDAVLEEIRARVFVPDGGSVEQALAHVTHLGVGAHQDDVEVLVKVGDKVRAGETVVARMKGSGGA